MFAVSVCKAVAEPEQKYNDRAENGIVLNRIQACSESLESNDFSAEKFVDKLLRDGSKSTCDNTSNSFNNNLRLPEFYNKKLCQQGQAFFYKHMFGLFLSKLLGLLALLSLSTLKILMMTNMSSTPLTAYKRYLATIFHMCVWYDEEFLPDISSDSKFWRSIKNVRNMHNSASNKSNLCLKCRVTQKDMALTQFGFMGISLVRSEMMGLHNIRDEEWKGFIHLWRVIGSVLGMEDRFNICRESVDETKKICEELIERVFIPHLQNTDEDFDRMSKALIDGMWAMNPVLREDVFLSYLHMTLLKTNDISVAEKHVHPLSRSAKIWLKYIMFVLRSMRFTVVRVFYSYLQICVIWIMKVFPFLAYYLYGKQNSHVKI